MRWLLVAIAAGLIILGVATWAGAGSMSRLPIKFEPVNDTLRALALKVGAPEDLPILISHTGMPPFFVNGAFFSPKSKECYPVCGPEIKLYQGPMVPEVIIIHVMLHELGHFMEWKADPENYDANVEKDQPAAERRSDAFAVNTACTLGMDGVMMMAANAEWIYKYYGIKGDPRHGSFAARLSYAETHAPACAPKDDP